MNDTVSHDSSLARSFLYVPGDQEAWLNKVFDRGADAVIVDLEDAVPIRSKSLSRSIVAAWISQQKSRTDVIWLRINADSLEKDLATITGQIAGVMVPRAEPDLISIVDELLQIRERELGLEPDTIAVIPLIESARGLLSAVKIAEVPRVIRLAIGRADLAAELGLGIDPEGVEFRSILLQLVIASSAAGITAPVAPTSTNFRDMDSLRESTEKLMSLGFRSRTAVHPAQISVINDVFTPARHDVERAQRLVVAFEEAGRTGSGVIVGEDGRMVDAAVVRSARDVLARARISNSNNATPN